MDKPAQTRYPIHDLLQQRWSPRAFSDRPVEPQLITRLFEAARWAPSSRNGQPWRFIVVTKDQPEAFQQLFDCLMPGNQAWAGQAPLLIVAVSPDDQSESSNPVVFYDTGQAVAYLTIEAMNHGLYMHQMGGINRDKIRKLYNIPATHRPMVVMAIGYLGQADDLPEDVRARELSERVRRPLEEIVFSGTWDDAADLA